MRTLLLLRGIQGIGKSTFIKENGLEPYTISADSVRLLFSSPIMNTRGEFEISQNYNNKVWKFIHDRVEERMERGEFIVIDATHTTKMINKYRGLANKHKYCVFVKEFDLDLERAIQQNANREEYKRVSNEIIERTYKELSTNRLPCWVNKIDNLDSIMNYTTVDLSKYRAIKFIGDIHGCYYPLSKLFENGVEDDIAYVFLGDYIDRGLNNYEVMSFMMDIIDKPNVYCIEGNHENVLYHLGKGIESPKLSFEQNTRPQLENLDKKKVMHFYKSLLQCMRIKYKDYEIFASHGGIPSLLDKLTLLSTRQLIKGVGGYDYDVDKKWENSDTNVIQIHGHRGLFETKQNTKSFSLEGQVEHNGVLKVIEISDDGLKHIDIPSCSTSIDPRMSYLINSPDIKIKNLEDGIKSLNFTEDVFNSGRWNSYTVKARGLFIDSEYKVIARGYNKFFNLMEVEDTQIDNLKQKLEYPIKIANKENGFLGILSHYKGELKFYTKSTDKGDHVKYFKDIFYSSIKGKEKELLNLIIKENLSITFEVIDPINDIHLVRYDKPCLYLLNTFKNTLDTIMDSHIDKVKEILKDSDVRFVAYDCMENMGDFFDRFIKGLEIVSFTEGYVITDAKGFMFKIKTSEYLLHKSFRALKHIIDRDKLITRELNPIQEEFVTWYKSNLDGLKQLNILDVIDEYNKYISSKAKDLVKLNLRLVRR